MMANIEEHKVKTSSAHNPFLNRRGFLALGMAAGLGACAGRHAAPQPGLPQPDRNGRNLPLADLHAHLDNSTIEAAAALARERGVTLGVVEHAGTEENKYPVVLSSDAELLAYTAMLDGHGVYKGVQAEWLDWKECFSRDALATLDYVLTDTMTFPGPDGKRMKMWEDGADMGAPSTFMDRYVDWHVRIIETMSADILANTSWLPPLFAADYDVHWTRERVRRVAEAARKNGVALEISSGFKLPRMSFLRVARECGVKFSFGSNGRHPNMAKLDYSLSMAAELELKGRDIYLPGTAPSRAVS